MAILSAAGAKINKQRHTHTPRFLLENRNILLRKLLIYIKKKYTLRVNTSISILITIVKDFRLINVKNFLHPCLALICQKNFDRKWRGVPPQHVFFKR